jgi:hypothetical protein
MLSLLLSRHGLASSISLHLRRAQPRCMHETQATLRLPLLPSARPPDRVHRLLSLTFQLQSASSFASFSALALVVVSAVGSPGTLTSHERLARLLCCCSPVCKTHKKHSVDLGLFVCPDVLAFRLPSKTSIHQCCCDADTFGTTSSHSPAPWAELCWRHPHFIDFVFSNLVAQLVVSLGGFLAAETRTGADASSRQPKHPT